MNVIVIGATGLLGSAVARANPGCVQINSKHFDATDSHSTHEWFLEHRDLVANSTIHICCGRVAGIGGQRDYAMFTENMRMAMNTLECAKQFQTTGTTVYYSSSCVYPAHLDVFDETDMLTGDFEVSNEGYAFAKAAGQRMCQYLNKQVGRRQFVTVIPPNLWGDNDNWNLQTCHVLPALTQKIMFAKREAQPVVTVWGSPKTRREFLRSDDVALGTLHFLNCESTVENVNIGYGEDIEIGTVVQGLCDRIGYTGAVEYTADRVGKTRRLLRVDCIRELGWQHSNSHDDMLDYMVEEATRRGLS
jgi:GDP-L-fucose synthase